jgi:hypothetical protein
MANPRTNPDFTEIASRFITMLRKTTSTGAIDYLRSLTNLYPANTTTNPGAAVAVSAAKTVYLGQASDILFGKLDHSEPDSTCVVQFYGVMTFSFVNDANAPVLGRGVVCNGSNGVRIAAAGSEWKERGVVLDLDVPNLVATVLVA